MISTLYDFVVHAKSKEGTLSQKRARADFAINSMIGLEHGDLIPCTVEKDDNKFFAMCTKNELVKENVEELTPKDFFNLMRGDIEWAIFNKWAILAGELIVATENLDRDDILFSDTTRTDAFDRLREIEINVTGESAL